MSPTPVTEKSKASTDYNYCVWLSNKAKETWIMFDMGDVMTLSGLRVWNYNEVGNFKRGVKTCQLRYGDSMLENGATYAAAGDWGTSAGTLTFAPSSGQGTAPAEGEDIMFSSPVTARYVMLLVIDNYGDTENYTGLSEVRFYSNDPPRRLNATGESSTAAYTVRGDDLLQTAVVSTDNSLVINTDNNNSYSKGTLESLTDGTFGDPGYPGGLCIKGGTVTYDLDVTKVPGGYDISEVHIYTGWTSYRENPAVVLYVRSVGENDFDLVGSFSYICEITATPRNTHLAIVDLDLTGVEAIRFDFGPATGVMQQNAGVGYKEIDVIRGGRLTVSPVAATSESAWYNRKPGNAIDGHLLSPARWPAGNGVTIGTDAERMWLCNNRKPTWIAFDLGSVRTVKGFHLWNYNEKVTGTATDHTLRGIKTAGVYVGDSMPDQDSAYSAAGAEKWGTLVQEMAFAKAMGDASYTGEDYFFDKPVTGRYLQLAITENHGAENYTGIGEIVFYCDADEKTVTRGASGSKEISDSLTGVTTVIDGEGETAPIALSSEKTRLHTLRGTTTGGKAQISGDGKTLALGKIELPEGTAGLEIMSGCTLSSVEGQRHWMEWTLDADLVIHGNFADGIAAGTPLFKTGSGTVTIDGTDTHKGNTFYIGGGYRQTGGTVDTRGATFTDVVCEFSGGTSRATIGIAFGNVEASVERTHTADWRSIDFHSGFNTLAVTNGGVLKNGYFTGNPSDCDIIVDGGTLATSALDTKVPWIPALGTITVGAGGATFDMSAADAVVEADISACGAIRKTGVHTLTLGRRVTGATKVDVEEGTLALSLPAPVIHYDFNSISGTTLPNLGTGGAALDGVVNGSPETVSGVEGNALRFAAEGQGVVTDGNVTLRQYTYAAWVKSSGVHEGSQRIIMGGVFQNSAFLGYMGTSDGKYWVFARSGTEMTADTVIDDTENWHHLVSTYDGKTLALYLDGALVQTKVLASNRISRTVKIGFGNNVTPNGEYWNGAIDEAYVFDRALSAEEVTMLMNMRTLQAVDVLDPDTELNIANGATLDLGGTEQTVATLSIGGHLKCRGETTWGAVGSGAAHETPRIVGSGILRVKGPAPRGMVVIIK